MRLLRLGPEEIQKLLDAYEKDCDQIKKSSLQLAWYMRGGASYEDILNMSTAERKAINEIVENNLEVTKKSQMPFF